MFGTDAIVLNGDDVIREVMVSNSDAFAGRPRTFVIEYIHRGFNITFSGMSESWSKLKKLTMNSLKMYGDGLQRLEDISLEAGNDVIDAFDRYGSTPFDPIQDVAVFMANVLFIIVSNF